MRFRCHHPLPGSKRFFRTGNARVAVLGGVKPAPPSLDLNFLKGPAFARGSVGSYFDSLGTLQTAAVNAPRYDFTANPAGVINWVRNSTAVGAVAGTPGTFPTNWSANATISGLTLSTSLATINGIPGIVFRWVGTPTATATLTVVFDGVTSIPTSNGAAWTESVSHQLVAGSVANCLFTTAPIVTDSGGSGLQNLASVVINPGATLARSSSSDTVANASAAFIQPRIRLGFTLNLAIDVSVFFGAPQLEKGSVANAFVPTSTVAVNGTGVGALMNEPAATNTIRNNTMAGAVAGTPGTLPTNWTQSQNTGIIPAVAGFGTEGGIPYIDLRFVGTVTGNTNNNLFFDISSAAVPSQVWTESAYLRLAAGSFAGVPNIYWIIGDNVVTANVSLGGAGQITAAPLATQRFSTTFTTNAGAVTSVKQGLTIVPTLGAAIDFTLRIGAPQLEPGSVATSLILTSGAALTRAAESGVPLDPRVTFTRASGASYFDQFGTMQTAASNQPRIDFGPNQGSNWIRNSTMQGAGVGVMPTNWTLAQPGSGITTAITAVGTDGATGYPYIDITLSGTANAIVPNGAGLVTFESATSIPGFTGQTWTAAVNVQIVSGTYAGTLNLDIAERDVGGGSVAGHSGPLFVPTAVLQRLSNPGVLFIGGAATQRAYPLFRWSCASGTVTDFTLRISAPQLELATSPNPYVPTSGVVRNTATPAPLGLLIEEARTNSIRNPRGEGSTLGVIGAGGVMPTNWSSLAGVTTVTVIGAGNEGGLPYIDIQFSGSATDTIAIPMESATTVAALQNQVWTESFYCRVIAGSVAGTTIQIAIMPTTSGGANITQGLFTFTPTTSPLASQRFSNTYTLPDATTAFVQPRLRVSVPAAAYNFTLRIGAPQLELGSSTSSLILPAVGTPAASARNGDLCTLPVGSWFNPLTFSMAADAMIPALVGSQQGLLLLDDGTANNRVTLRRSGAPINVAGVIASATTLNSSGDTMPIGVPFKAAAAIGASGAAIAVNGVLGQSTAGAVPSGLSTLRVGQNSAGGTLENGYMRRARVWPRALSPQELRAATL